MTPKSDSMSTSSSSLRIQGYVLDNNISIPSQCAIFNPLQILIEFFPLFGIF